MGKHINSELYRQFDRSIERGLDDAMDDSVQPLTEEERAAEWDDHYWERKDAEALPRHVTLGDEMYAPGVRRVLLGGVQ